MRKLLFCGVFLAAMLTAVLAHGQQLTIQIDGGKQVVFGHADIEALPHTKVTVGVADVSTTFEGVSLKAVLDKAGVQFGEALKGKRLASYLLVEAADGYRVVIALPEIDPTFTDKQIVLAFTRNGKPLDEHEGPYRIVIPDEKRMARWVRQVTTLKILEIP